MTRARLSSPTKGLRKPLRFRRWRATLRITSFTTWSVAWRTGPTPDTQHPLTTRLHTAKLSTFIGVRRILIVRFSQYFHDKKRNWEFRFQCTFKKATRACDLRVSCSPFERLPISATQASMQRLMLKIAGQSLGSFYNSPGDDPQSCEGEAEHPVTSVALCESDQHIAHSAGEELPSLADCRAFSQLGRLKVHGAAEYRKALNSLTFQAGETHAFAFWGPARFFNLVEWRTCSSTWPPVPSLSLDALNGPPPLILSVYHLTPNTSGGGETRHVESRMQFLTRAAGWSSQYPPSAEWMQRLTKGSTNSKVSADILPQEGRSGLQQRRSTKSSEELSHSADAGCCGSGICQLFHACCASIGRVRRPEL